MRNQILTVSVVASLVALGCNNGLVHPDAGPSTSGTAGSGGVTGFAGTIGAAGTGSETAGTTGAAGSTAGTGAAGDLGVAGTGSTAGTGGGGGQSDAAAPNDGGAAGTTGTAGTGAGAAGTGAAGTGTGDPTMRSGPFKMLVFSWTTGFHHDSIPAAQQMAKDIGASNPIQTFQVDIANVSPTDPTGSCEDNNSKPIAGCTAGVGVFNDDNLKKYEIVYFANPTGDDFSGAGAAGVAAKAAFEKYMSNGGAYIGVHSATDFEKGGNWTFYNDLLGGLFDHHDGDGTPGTVVIQDLQVNHPVVRGMPKTTSTQDEWYYQLRNPEGRPGITILAKLASDQRPIAWVHDVPGGGRMVYTVRGHNITRFSEPWMRTFFLQGVMWATHRIK